MSTIVLTAGGTGGHLFPAQSLAMELTKRGFGVELITDERAGKFGQDFAAGSVHIVDSDTFRSRNPLSMIRTVIRLVKGYRQSLKILLLASPDIVTGFGGYPTIPPIFAARRLGIPTVLHEANSIMGKANRLLARSAAAIGISYPAVKLGRHSRAKQVQTGTPLRSEVLDACSVAYQLPEPNGRFRLLVFGGSQGASVFSQLIPAAMEILPNELRQRIDLVQQFRQGEIEFAATKYSSLNMNTELKEFFDDMPERISRSHLVICRSGASTVGELAAIGRPAILLPLPDSREGDQMENARMLSTSGGAILHEQSELTPEKLAGTIADLMNAPEKLARIAECAKLQGKTDAAARLADLVVHIASGGRVDEFKLGGES